jgi:hypothetical protein
MQPDTPEKPKALDPFTIHYEDLDEIIANSSTNIAGNLINKDLEETNK